MSINANIMQFFFIVSSIFFQIFFWCFYASAQVKCIAFAHWFVH